MEDNVAEEIYDSKDYSSLDNELANAELENKYLRETLKWYAEQNNWIPGRKSGIVYAHLDAGARARDALKKVGLI